MDHDQAVVAGSLPDGGGERVRSISGFVVALARLARKVARLRLREEIQG